MKFSGVRRVSRTMSRSASVRRRRRIRVVGNAIKDLDGTLYSSPSGALRYHTRMPTPLRHTSALALEFEALLELLRGYTQSPLGRGRIDALAPVAARDWIARQQQLTRE